MFDLPQPFGPTIAVMPGVTLMTVFSPNDLKPWSAIDSRRMVFLTTEKCLRPKKKYHGLGHAAGPAPKS
ncbi:MAG: hypothetical protein A3G97_05550 [Candidatus Rokubacteria bacterium RIFCSPLOWO2_12_FULL_69_21]|nr:MAG: hypothetical protein A3G97_05550 [Candidatus Rokubacteria bacterium RIFCSPLOWO2_12_FULL_69_21]